MGKSERISILLVEDSPADAELALACLKEFKVANEVTWLPDGEDALDYVLRRRAYNRRTDPDPDLIFLDLKMPRLGGIEFARQLKGNPATAHIAIIVMTSSKDDQDIIDSYNLGTNGYIVKPLTFENFAEVTRAAGFDWLAVARSA
jgi:CheY-like chemotaxis protein